MKFRFNVNITEQDYLNYNSFWMLRSPYGKKQMLTLRLAVTAIFVILIFITCFGFAEGYIADTLLSIIPLGVFLILFHIFLNKLYSVFLRVHMNALKKKGKMGYSPSSIMEFYDDHFVETTVDNKSENKYTAVERISIVGNKMLYIHVNNIMCYMLPFASFENKEQYNDFMSFIKTKCNSIDFYK